MIPLIHAISVGSENALDPASVIPGLYLNSNYFDFSGAMSVPRSLLEAIHPNKRNDQSDHWQGRYFTVYSL